MVGSSNPHDFLTSGYRSLGMRNSSGRPAQQPADVDPPSLPRASLWCVPDRLKGSAFLCLLPGSKVAMSLRWVTHLPPSVEKRTE